MGFPALYGFVMCLLFTIYILEILSLKKRERESWLLYYCVRVLCFALFVFV